MILSGPTNNIKGDNNEHEYRDDLEDRERRTRIMSKEHKGSLASEPDASHGGTYRRTRKRLLTQQGGLAAGGGRGLLADGPEHAPGAPGPHHRQ